MSYQVLDIDMSEKILVVAFDGLDSELVDKFDLEHVNLDYIGSVDNQTGMSRIMTSELFASFITGTNYEEHGVKGLQYYDNGFIGSLIERTVARPFIMQNIRGSHRLQDALLGLFQVKRRRYTKKDLEIESIFDKIENSRAMFVPGYNPDVFWETRCESKPLEYGYDKEKYLEFWDNRAYKHRKKTLFNELSIMSRPLLMCHFHRTDLHQHVYGDKSAGLYDEEKLYKLYKETDELAAKIKDKAIEAGYDTIIFMSDHGLPEDAGNKASHNKNAYYSSNKKLFEETPKITDFHDRIIEISKQKNARKKISKEGLP